MILLFILGNSGMQLFLILLIVLGGMGLSVEAGLLGPLGEEVGELWATFSIFGVGAALTFILMLFFSPRNSPSFFAQPSWMLLGGILGPIYVVILTITTPIIGIAMTMIGVLAGQVFKSLIIDHYGLLGAEHRRIDSRRIIALFFIVIALILVAQG
jgi:transporter family-2 protein